MPAFLYEGLEEHNCQDIQKSEGREKCRLVTAARGRSNKGPQRDKGIEKEGGDTVACINPISFAKPETSPTVNCFPVKREERE